MFCSLLTGMRICVAFSKRHIPWYKCVSTSAISPFRDNFSLILTSYCSMRNCAFGNIRKQSKNLHDHRMAWQLYFIYFIFVFISEVHIHASICVLVLHWHGVSTTDRVAHAIILLVMIHSNNIMYFQMTLVTYSLTWLCAS